MITTELKDFVSNWLFLRRQAIRLSLFCRLADMKQRAHNKKYYVIVYGGRLRMFSDAELQRKYYYGALKSPVSYVKHKALYSTPSPSSSRKLSPKEKEEMRKQRKKAIATYSKFVQKQVKNLK